MKSKKSLKNRIISGLMSAAMLTSASASAMISVPVSAADNDYYEALALSLYFFDANACGSDVDEGPLTWRGDCHTYDGKAAISDAENFDSSMKSIVDPDGDGYVDVDGGYHDAGDHIKFNLTMGFGMSSLAMSEYLNPGVYEKAGCKDHMMAILKRNAEYLMKTTFLDGSGNVATICHVVADGNADHAEWKSPELQTYSRKTYWLTKSKNNSAVCGEMASALAGAAYVWKTADASFASECLKYAKAIYQFGSSNKGNYTGGLGGFYDTDSMCEDELALAQAWLWVNGEGAKPTLTPSRGQYGGIYDYYRYTWDKVWQGYAAMMYKATGENAFKEELIFEINNQGGLNTGTYNGDGWGAARYNCALQMSGYAVANGDKTNQYATGGKWQMDYILGDNPTGYSFLIGYGSKSPTHYHHRAANPGTGNPQDNTAAKYTLYGALVGGIDASGNYEDHSDKYQYTEPALDYNGCFALACAALADMFGGSDKAAANIASKASEITYPFNFGSGSTVTPTESTPTETEPPKTETSAPETTAEPPKTDLPESTKQPQQSGQKDASYTELKNDEGNTYWKFDITGGTKLTITMKTNSSDTMANGAFNPQDAKDYWEPQDWSASANGGTYTVTYTVPSGHSYVDFYVWWPTSATLVSAVLTTTETPSTTAEPSTTESKTTTTQTVATETTPIPSNPSTNVTVYGDANQDGKADILDVIQVNKAILGKGTLSAQGLTNIDFNKNNAPDANESLAILKLIVGLFSEADLANF